MEKPSKPMSPHVGFYKSYGRPIAKVFLGAVFTYQAVYWLWVKLETDEIMARKKKISRLEAQIRDAQGKSTP
ncbi:hypothetical protein JMJ35_001403 [Cladonia borealis]|uniref:Uncharacterized protein n=1 Tax=Cladonia borealis TaxID=184061 RepID=A0AA39RAB9_9LECA|nr:hypothetical protein JMJ35_001403 [Cladonia borealis]